MRALRALQHRRPEGGFTLIELLVVIVILGLLAAIVVFATRGTGDRGKEAAIGTDERTIRTAMEIFCGRNGRYPGGPAAPEPFKADPMGELVAGKYLSNRSGYHKLSTGDNTPELPNAFPEGKCTGTPKNYLLEVASPGSTVPPPEQPFGAVAAGLHHSLRLTSEGKVFASGNNGFSQLGDGTTTNRERPVQVKGGDSGSEFLGGVKAVVAGPRFSLALKDDATVWSWGGDLDGVLGNGDAGNSTTPVQVLGKNGSGFLTGVTAIETGSNSSHVLALRSGEVWAWGNDSQGQLGDGSGPILTTTPVQVSNLSGVTAIAAGQNHSLAVKDGKVWAWGRNRDRQLGDKTTSDRTEPVEIQDLGGSVTAIAAGELHSVALTNDGTVWVWGVIPGGDGTRTDPVQIKGSDGNPFGGVTAIASGRHHVLASKNGEVWAWGTVLGNGSTTPSATPVRVRGYRGVNDLDGATDLSGGDGYSMAAMRDGRVLAWGSNINGQFGTGDWEGSWVPTDESDETPPTNDDFAPDPSTGLGGRIVLPWNHPGQITTTGTNMFASPEPDEPGHGGSPASRSVWYEWTVPASVVSNGGGNATFYTVPHPNSVESSNFNTRIAAYITNDPLNPPSISQLTPVDLDQNDNSSPGEQSRVTVPATPGVVYFIAIDGRSGTDQGGIKLTSYIYTDPRKPCGGPC